MNIGILGLPNVGKSTLFNALTKSTAAMAANYPFCTIEPNVGIVEVPDNNLNEIAKIINPERILHAQVEFTDIAGLVRGASKGEGLGNKFLAHVREADALVEVVRFFEDGEVTHVDGKVDPKADKETIETELILADMESVSKRIGKLESECKSGDAKKIAERDFVKKILEALEKGEMARTVVPSNENEEAYIKQLNLLTGKKIFYMANVSESAIGNITPEECAKTLGVNTEDVVVLCAKLEAEFIGLEGDDLKEMLESYGLAEAGLGVLARKAYEVLGLQSFYTAGVKEVRAWTVKAGATAPQAAGVIHSDFEKKFIRAEVAGYKDFVEHGGWAGVKEKGKMRTEGKDYVMKNDDVCYFLTSA